MGSSRIAGQKERDLNEIQSAAYRQVHQIRGEADGKATEIYAHAYTQNAQAAEFYNFLKSMDTLSESSDQGFDAHLFHFRSSGCFWTNQRFDFSNSAIVSSSLAAETGFFR